MSHDAAAAADIAPIRLSLVDADLVAAAEAFGDAFERTGFAVFVDHGVGADLVDRARTASRAFFARPTADKLAYRVGIGGARGYTAFAQRTAASTRPHPTAILSRSLPMNS